MNTLSPIQKKASITPKRILLQFYVDCKKIFGTTEIGSHTNTTTQLVNKRKILVSPVFQSNKLIRINSHGLLDNNFLKTVLEIRFPTSVAD